jgi:hypothetical protein
MGMGGPSIARLSAGKHDGALARCKDIELVGVVKMATRCMPMVKPERQPVPRGAWLLAGAAVATALACAVFASMPPMQVHVGRAVMSTTVPIGYQLSVFPAFGAMLASIVLDLGGRDGADPARRARLRTSVARALLVAITGGLSVARLAGALPLSGHALFLFAALAYALVPPTDRDAPVVLGTAIPALLVVGWSKLVVWGDPVWFGVSAVLGTAIGAALARVSRS